MVNAYPMDVSLTFTRSKGIAPLYQAGPGTSRVLITACPEGLGHHGLFPFMNGPRFERQLHQLRRLSGIRPATLPGKVGRRVGRLASRVVSRQRIPAAAGGANGPTSPSLPIWLLVPDLRPGLLPDSIPGLEPHPEWTEILARVQAEQAGKQLQVVVYPCAPLQCLQWQGSERTGHLTELAAG